MSFICPIASTPEVCRCLPSGNSKGTNFFEQMGHHETPCQVKWHRCLHQIAPCWWHFILCKKISVWHENNIGRSKSKIAWKRKVSTTILESDLGMDSLTYRSQRGPSEKPARWIWHACPVFYYLLLSFVNLILLFCMGFLDYTSAVPLSCVIQGCLPPQWRLNESSEILCRLTFRRLVELCPCSREPIFQKAMAMVRLCQVEDP